MDAVLLSFALIGRFPAVFAGSRRILDGGMPGDACVKRQLQYGEALNLIGRAVSFLTPP
jgi:hypothetical protein